MITKASVLESPTYSAKEQMAKAEALIDEALVQYAGNQIDINLAGWPWGVIEDVLAKYRSVGWQANHEHWDDGTGPHHKVCFW